MMQKKMKITMKMKMSMKMKMENIIFINTGYCICLNIILPAMENLCQIPSIVGRQKVAQLTPSRNPSYLTTWPQFSPTWEYWKYKVHYLLFLYVDVLATLVNDHTQAYFTSLQN